MVLHVIFVVDNTDKCLLRSEHCVVVLHRSWIQAYSEQRLEPDPFRTRKAEQLQAVYRPHTGLPRPCVHKLT